MREASIRAIIFDCFGVLTVDAQKAYEKRLAGDKQLQQFHYLNHMRDKGMLSRDEYFQEVSQLTGQTPGEVREHFLSSHQLNEPLIDYIQTELKGRYKIGMLSNIGRGWIHSFFGQELLDTLFDAVVLSSEEGMTKPHPAIYERIAAKLDVEPEECLMIDDIQRNCDGAENVGMSAVLFQETSKVMRDVQKRLQG